MLNRVFNQNSFKSKTKIGFIEGEFGKKIKWGAWDIAFWVFFSLKIELNQLGNQFTLEPMLQATLVPFEEW
jgi:hypothetical protein